MPRHAALFGRRAFAQNAAQSPQQRPNVIITPPTAPARRSGAAGAFDVLNAVFADRKSCLCGVFALLAAAAALASGTVEAAAPATTAALEEEGLPGPRPRKRPMKSAAPSPPRSQATGVASSRLPSPTRLKASPTTRAFATRLRRSPMPFRATACARRRS